jgi:prepilin-type N-terminal cleavage/methylation domain-containing protein
MKKAFTLMELLVVVLILGLLATVAVGVFTTQVERARYAAARTTIAAIELAATRYQLDVGEFPPSGSINPVTSAFEFEGNGFMYHALTRSMSGNTSSPANARWQGPYLDVKKLNLGNLNGMVVDDLATSVTALQFGEIMILDPWGSPYRYVRSNGSDDDNYVVNFGTKLPAGNPYASTDVYYNPTTFQVASKGRNGETLPNPEFGLEEDDVNNFGF